jgi:type IV pilus assembly protein PilM
MSLNPFRRKSLVGIDLGHYSIKAVQVDRTPSGWRVVHAEQTPTPPDAIKDGVVVDTEAVTGAIRRLIKSSHLSATSACISVAGGSVVVRTVRVPKMAEVALRKSIKFEAGRYVPSSVDDSYIEFEIVGPAPENQMEVLIVAAPKNIVESRVKACEDAGFEVEVVDVEAFAAFRALIEASETEEDPDGAVALVDIGRNSTNVSVVSRGVFSMTRAIPQGGQTLTDALRTYFKLEEADAEAGKQQLDFRELLHEEKPSENPPLRVLQPHVDDLVREVRRSLNYYQSQQTEAAALAPVTSLVLTGGGAKLPGLAEYMAAKLDLRVAARGVFDNPRFAGADGDDSGLELCVATGLAMRGALKAA